LAGKNPLAGMKLTGIDDLFKTDAERQGEAQERVIKMPLDKMRYFKEHPFKVRHDKKMLETIESVEKYGVLMPGLVRPCADNDGFYEIVAGHRRHYASEMAGRTEMPVIVRDLTDDEATIIMVDSNLQREIILPSEKAFAYKMKLDAMKRQAGRPGKENCDQIGYNFEGKKSIEILAEQSDDSRNQIQRYIRLTELIPPLLELVDNKVMAANPDFNMTLSENGENPLTMAFNPAVEVSYLPREEQEILYAVMERDECSPSMAQAAKLRKCSADGRFNEDTVTLIMNDEKPFERKVVFRDDKLKKYFPPGVTAQQVEKTIIKLLEDWQRKREREHEHTR